MAKDERLVNPAIEKQFKGRSYEEIVAVLEGVGQLKEWRVDAKIHPQVKLFYDLVESINLSQVKDNPIDKKELARILVAHSHRLSPRLADMYLGLLSRFDGMPYKPTFESTTTKINKLEEDGDLEILFNNQIPFVFKKNRMSSRLVGDLLGRISLDALEKKQRREKKDDDSKHKSSMDETKYLETNKKGELPYPNILIVPAYGGYWRRQSFDIYEKGIWRQSEYDSKEIALLEEAGFVPKDARSIVINKITPKTWMRLSLAEHFYIFSSEENKNNRIKLRVDCNGDYLIYCEDDQPIKLFLQERYHKRANTITPVEKPMVQSFFIDLTDETMQYLQEVRDGHTSNLTKAKLVATYAMRHLKYPKKSDFDQIESYDALYDNHPNGKIGGIDRICIADCDTAADYGAALCSYLNIPVRLVVGDYVEGKDKEGNGRITDSTGHGWLDVWDDEKNEWERVDFTPPGDTDEEDAFDSILGESGDFSEQESIVPSDEELEQLEKYLQKASVESSYAKSEREMANEANITLDEARKILKEITKANGTRLKNGQLALDVLQILFSQIIETRKTDSPKYTGLFTQSDGGEDIIDEEIVAHALAVKSGNMDPATRNKETKSTEEESNISGFDVISIHNRSASSEREFNGAKIYEHQRLAAYLINTALANIQEKVNKMNLDLPLSIRTQNISFLGGSRVVEDKPLSEKFTNVDKVTMWKSLSTTQIGDADSFGLTYVLNQIKKELGINEEDSDEEIQKKLKKDKKLRLIFITTDGEPDKPALVHKLTEQLGNLGAVVVGIGLTEIGKKAELLYTTANGCVGVVADSPQDIPRIIASFVIKKALELFPEKSGLYSQAIINETLAKL